VSNTAAATLQQLVLSGFEKVAKEDGQLHTLYTKCMVTLIFLDQDSNDGAVVEVPATDGTRPICSAALDAYHVCLHTVPQFGNLLTSLNRY